MRECNTTSRLPPWRGWVPLLILPTAALLLTPATWPRWAYMWVICVAMFAGLKWLTWRRTPAAHASLGRHIGYLLAWPGLDAVAFLAARPPRPGASEWLDAAGKLIAGVGIVWGIVRLIPPTDDLLRGWVGMIGIILALHFGPFHLLSCACARPAWTPVG